MAEHKHAEVLRAIADGKVVQWQSNTTWIDGNESVNPLKFPSLNWRVKPEPKPDITRYVAVDTSGCESLDEVKSWAANYRGYLKLISDGETGKLKSVEIVE